MMSKTHTPPVRFCLSYFIMRILDHNNITLYSIYYIYRLLHKDTIAPAIPIQ